MSETKPIWTLPTISFLVFFFNNNEISSRFILVGIFGDSTVISCTILISGKVVVTLIDIGATHSFVSEIFMRSLGIVPTYEPLHYSIMLPSGDELSSTSFVRACSVQVNERIVYADLIVIYVVAFDVILGMDWLSTYRAVIDCIQKTVRFLT